MIRFSIFTAPSISHNNSHSDLVTPCFVDCDNSEVVLNGHAIRLTVYNWSAADYDQINVLINSIDWHQLFGFNFEVESIWSEFKSLLWPIIDVYVPKKSIPHNAKYKLRIYPKFIRNLLSRKAAIWRLLKHQNNPTLKNKYNRIARECKIAIIKFDSDRELKLLNANNLGAFYKFVNTKLSSPSGIAPLVNASGQLLTSDLDKANLLNEFFESVFTQDNGTAPNFPNRLPPGASCINDVKITPAIISRILVKLKSNAAAGPDCLPPIFFHKTAKTISYSLSVIFRTFLDLHELPSEWKISYISPKFKKGSPSDPTNYRPISLTCTLCKVFESIIATEIIEFLLKHNLINENQHGFLKKHSTCTNLLETLNDWTIHLSNNKSVMVAYIDFTRAFDSVSHSKLLNKLISYGISGNLLFWIQPFITNRSHCSYC